MTTTFKTMKLFAIMVLMLTAISCGSKKEEKGSTETATTTQTLTVDQLLANPENYLDSTVTIEGLCSHLCSQGGRKAFIQGNADNMQIRCEAFPGMKEPFPGEAVHKPMKVTGILREQRIDEEYLKCLEESVQNDRDRKEATCETERAAHGQKEISTLEGRVADYRARIAENVAKGGNPYLSFYYIESTGYEILPE